MQGAGDPRAIVRLHWQEEKTRPVGGSVLIGGAAHPNLRELLIPGQPLRIEHSPQAPKDGMRALIAHCAKLLDYDIVDPPATEESAAPHPQHAAPRPAAGWEAGAGFVANVKSRDW
jgi:hypothetical protein